MHVVERYAEWAVEWRGRPIPLEVAHHARRAVIDWCSVDPSKVTLQELGFPLCANC